jgi:hypothetical protein
MDTTTKLLLVSIDRVLDFMGIDDSYDSEAEFERTIPREQTEVELTNKSLRANLVPTARES